MINKLFLLITLTLFTCCKSNSQENNPLPFDINTFDRKHLPMVYDLRNTGRLPLVKAQPPAGCWASAANGSLESFWYTAGYKPGVISDINLKICNGFVKDRSKYGNQHMATAYYTSLRGPVEKGSCCDSVCYDRSKLLTWVTDARFLPPDPRLIKQVVMEYGAVYSMMYYKDQFLDSLNHCYYYDGNYKINHSVIIAGWNDTMKTAGGKGAWIVQNSRSKNFGDKGFFYVSYQDKAFLSESAVWPGWEKADPKTELFMYDTLGSFFSYGFRDSVCCGLVKFVPGTDVALTDVATWINFAGTKVTFEIYNDFDPSKGILSNVLLSSFTKKCRFPGYYTFALPAMINIGKGNDFYIMARYVTAADTTPMPVETYIKGYSYPHIVTKKCWVSPDNIKWPTTWYEAGTESPWVHLHFDLCIRAIGIGKKE